MRSRARGLFEEFVFILGGDIGRCGSCGARFLCFRWFKLPAPRHSGYTMNGDSDAGFVIAWVAISAGILISIGFAFWILHKFHRWPF